MTRQIPEQLVARLYGYADADRIAGVTRGTAKRWLSGYSYVRRDGRRVDRPPVTAGRAAPSGGVSFSDLIELVAIGGFKERGFTVPTIRRIVQNCQDEFDEPYPLSTQRFKIGGRDVFVSEGSLLRDVLHQRGARAWDDILGPFLDTLDYRDSFAYRWWPLGRSKPVIVDPAYGFGLPVIVGSGVRTEIIRERVQAGDSHEQIAYDFQVRLEEIESAIQFELQRAA